MSLSLQAIKVRERGKLTFVAMKEKRNFLREKGEKEKRLSLVELCTLFLLHPSIKAVLKRGN